MHRRALALLFVILPLLSSSCDMQGLPNRPTATVATIPQATTTTAGVSQLPTQAASQETLVPTSTAHSTAEAIAPIGPTVATGNSATDKVLLAVEQNAVTVRELQPQKDVPEVIINREQLRANLVRDFKQDYSQEEARQDAVGLWLLRLSANRSLNLYQLFIDLYTEQIAGYYDPKKGELFVLSEGKELSPGAKQTLAHEFVHSLQDQHYDLQKLLPEHSKAEDRDRAVRALVEGDATTAGLMYAYRYMSSKEFEDMINESKNAPTTMLDRVPPYIKDDLLFSYEAGSAFVSKLIERGDFARVNAALADPPQSTEQIMHPEKYMQVPRDEPIPVVIPPLTSTLGAGWTYRDGYTYGEFDVNALLKETGASNADAAAAGWGGGQTAFYEKGDSALYIVDTRWDTKNDATEFDTALRSTFKKAKRVGDVWSDGGRFFGIIHSGDRVALVATTDQKTLESAMTAIK